MSQLEVNNPAWALEPQRPPEMKNELELLRLREITLRTELSFLLSNQMVRDNARIEEVRREIEAVVKLKRELLRQQQSPD
jgi:hypothetical protein